VIRILINGRELKQERQSVSCVLIVWRCIMTLHFMFLYA